MLSVFARMAEQAPLYIYTALVFTDGITALGVAREPLLAAVLVASLVEFFWHYASAALGDEAPTKVLPNPVLKGAQAKLAASK
ncbi:hypothetical protein [Burkholderia sp. BCC0405]|uniref:hypothetical protein n=1 Tax=Burkholderia sp. BCC0405 TaxID=2676298 RepID=UPI00158D86BA|nr:hypothetical protein [Burkholderia sp. BCC0405]